MESNDSLKMESRPDLDTRLDLESRPDLEHPKSQLANTSVNSGSSSFFMDHNRGIGDVFVDNNATDSMFFDANAQMDGGAGIAEEIGEHMNEDHTMGLLPSPELRPVIPLINSEPEHKSSDFTSIGLMRHEPGAAGHDDTQNIWGEDLNQGNAFELILSPIFGGCGPIRQFKEADLGILSILVN
eukprot:TRINITY_DN7915_c0_g1_i1.p1 TRINITY_DN7915_c0_g1~~TRINITY_DN7915_c0_g1_i1.p1  ORF type:complete len:184 (+),score=34.13 TRINITY_DN7915_c0_g1_i1:197-748(+)